MAKASSHNSQQKPTFKPLSVEQQNTIDLLILGKSDQETAETVGVDRSTIWIWKKEHPLFMATLERRRAEVWRQPQERLRSLLSKAVENLAAAVEEGDVKVSIEVLKAVGMYGDATMNAIHEQDPKRIIHKEAERRVRAEGISEDPTHDMLIDMTTNPAYQRRLAEVMEELYQEYIEVG